MTEPETQTSLNTLVEQAKAGHAPAFEMLLHTLQPKVYQLALRFLWMPEDAEDASQEILIKVLTHLTDFNGGSAFTTWVYRIAVNHLLSAKKKPFEAQAMSFDEFSDDLQQGLANTDTTQHPEEQKLLEEVKIGCTTAMLLCLNRPHRIAYILGDILELEHQEAAEVMDITRDTFRKRLSRARQQIQQFMVNHCGIVNSQAACHCRRRINTAIELGRVMPQALRFVNGAKKHPQFSHIEYEVRQLEQDQRAAALYRSQHIKNPVRSMTPWLRELLRRHYTVET